MTPPRFPQAVRRESRWRIALDTVCFLFLCALVIAVLSLEAVA